MIEARIFTDSLEPIKAILVEQGAKLMGEFEIIEEIYHSRDASVALNDELLRLRVMPKNIWDEKDVILAVKRTNLKRIGKESEIPLRLEFDDEVDAREYVEKNLLGNYEYDFSFARTGHQYFLPNGDVLDLEMIEGHPSVEFKSKTPKSIAALLELFRVSRDNVILGPSVVGVKKLLSNDGQTLCV